MIDPVIIVHGGAGTIKFNVRHRRGIEAALEGGHARLRAGGSALDAVVEAVSIMEDISVFNAGRGAVPSLTGDVEMDAAVMVSDGRSGAVAAIRDVSHPIQVARLVMERTDHRLLVGDGACLFARRMGFDQVPMLTDERRRLYHRAIKRMRAGNVSVFSKLPDFLDLALPQTVGAVALDASGQTAAATSTGGMLLHLPGRVGDSPIIGAGTWASTAGAASITGHGEMICRELVSWRIVSMLKDNSPQEAADRLLAELAEKKCSCGLICIDERGIPAAAWNTPGMTWGYQTALSRKVG